jgi:YVTN family beta-propeller protein
MVSTGRRTHRFMASVVVASLVACGSYDEPPITIITAHPLAAALSSRLSGISGRPFAVRLSPSGVIAVTQQDANSIVFTDTTNDAPRSVKVGADPGDVVFNNSGTRAYVSAFNAGTITIIDVASASPIATVPIAANAYRLALMTDESKLFVTSTDGHVYIVNLSLLTVSSLALSGALNGCALDVFGRYLYVTSTGGNVWKIDVLTSGLVATTNRGGIGQEVALAPNGSEIYVANEAGWVDVLDAATLAPRARIARDGAPFGLAVTSDGLYLYVTSPLDGMIDIVNVVTRAVVKRLHVGGTPRRATFDALGLAAFVANESNYVDVIR